MRPVLSRALGRLVCAGVLGCGDNLREPIADGSIGGDSPTLDGAGDAPMFDGNCARSAGGESGDSAGAIAAAVDGDVAVAGYFTGPATFGAGEANATTLTAPHGLFVARYHADCTLAWARQVVGPQSRGNGNNLGMGITIKDDAIYVTASFAGSVTLGSGEPTETTLVAAGANELFLARYALDGDLVWARGTIGTATVQATGVAVSGTSVYVTGWFSGAATFGLGEPTATTLATTAGSELFVARHGADGTLVRAWQVGGANGTMDTGGIVAAPSGGVVVTGGFDGMPTFGLGGSTATTLMPNGVFVARYDQDDSLIWAKRAGGNGAARGYAIAAVADASAVVVTGYFGYTQTPAVGNARFGAAETAQTILFATPSIDGFPDLFVAKFALADGILQWAKKAGGSQWDVGLGIAVTADGSAIVAGDFGGPDGVSAMFGSGESGQTSLTATGYDVFVARYAVTSGALAWVKQGRSAGHDDAYGVAVSPDDSATTTGRFGTIVPADSTATFDPGTQWAMTVTSAGTEDAFLVRFKP